MEWMWEGQGTEGLLASFSEFVGFSIEGCKEEVLEFFNNMKKRRAHGQELNKLDWSIKNKRVN